MGNANIDQNTQLATPVSVANGGTGGASHTAYAVLCGGTTSTAAIQSIASVGTSGQVLTSNGAGALPTFQAAAGGGAVKQIVGSSTTSRVTTTTAMPADGTIPQNTEGAELITQAITPTSASSTLTIIFSGNMAAQQTTEDGCFALFVDSDASAVACTPVYIAATNDSHNAMLIYQVSAVSTSARTYKIRFGVETAAITCEVNARNGTQNFGGVETSTLMIIEHD